MSQYTFGIRPSLAKRISPHMHPYWEILYYIEGAGTLDIGGEKIEFSPGHIVLQPPNVIHSEYSKEKFRNIYFHFEGFIPPKSTKFSVFKDNQDRDFGKLVWMALKIYNENTAYSNRILRKLVETMYEYLYMWSEKKVDLDPSVEAIKNGIMQNFSNASLDINEEIKRSGFSIDHFRRLFTEEVGCTPHQYLTKIRLKHAEELLKHQYYRPPLKIKEVALLCGFTDPYYFSRLYKNIAGESPSQTMQKNLINK